ncbi:MAG: nickel pincer cofactor biosynthesis protein LarB [Acidimicrobiales bacterium]
MHEAALRAILDAVRTGEVSPDDAVRRLRHLPFEDIGYARLDHHRALRQGFPEAVYGPGKTVEEAAGIVARLAGRPDGGPVILTRASPAQVEAALTAVPGGRVTGSTVPGSTVPGSTVVWRPAPPRTERVLVVTAGTADAAVADECAATLKAFGWEARGVRDVGVAGLHRILGAVGDLMEADAVVVVAGMEGALASVVGGLTAAPVVAVPTSTGYGSSLEGVTALLGMLASCAAGLAVVGVDNGFGAAHVVARSLGTA